MRQVELSENSIRAIFELLVYIILLMFISSIFSYNYLYLNLYQVTVITTPILTFSLWIMVYYSTSVCNSNIDKCISDLRLIVSTLSFVMFITGKIMSLNIIVFVTYSLLISITQVIFFTYSVILLENKRNNNSS